jgi:hypothetical protein
MRRATASGGLTAFVAVAALALLVPAAASALTVRVEGSDRTQTQLVLEDASGETNDVGISMVAAVPGEPDVVIGDTSAGIADPIPPQCSRVSAQIIRCLAELGIRGDLGAGNDSLGVAPEFTSPRAFSSVLPVLQMNFGPGADRASDLSAARDVWNGGPGRDQLASGPGDDKVDGGAQNDVIDCGPGKHDVGIGGPGKRDLGRRCEVVKH